MYPWLLALLVLIGVCAIGAYYVHNTRSGLEGFDASGNSANPSVLRRKAEAQCELNYQGCLEKNSNLECTSIYNKCNDVAQKLDISVSTVANAPGSKTQFSSAQGALEYAKLYGKDSLGAGDAVSWAKSGDMLKAQYGDTSNPDFKFLNELKHKLDNGELPTKGDVKKAQGLGFFGDNELLYDKLAAYVSAKKRIAPHETPKKLVPAVTAHLCSDLGTDADDGHDEGTNSLRTQIRRDIKKAVHDEMNDIDNEYEIKYS